MAVTKLLNFGDRDANDSSFLSEELSRILSKLCFYCFLTIVSAEQNLTLEIFNRELIENKKKLS